MEANRNLQEKISFNEKIAMLLGGMGGVPLFAIITAFLVYFYTNVIGLDAGAVGMIILASKFFDGISDILFGRLIDKTRTKMGVSRPWVLRGAAMSAIGIIALFTVPSIGMTGKLIYVFISYNLSQTIIYTIVLLAVSSLPTYMTRDSVQRSGLFVWCTIGQGIMMAVVTSFTLQIVTALGGGQKAWIMAAVGYAIIGTIFLLLTGTICKERVNPDEISADSQKLSFLMVIKSIIANKYWIQVLLIVIFGAGVFASSAMMSPYYAQYILGNANIAGILNAAYTIPIIIVSFLFLPLVKKMTKKNIIFMSVTVQLLGCLLIIFMPTAIPILIVGTLMKSVGQAGGSAMYLPMLGDAIEYGQWKTGVRSQAALMGANGAGQKIGQGVMSAALGGIMSMAGFNGLAATQSAAATASVSGLFLYAPLVFTILELIVVFVYDLDKHYPDIMKDLKDRETAAKKDREK